MEIKKFNISKPEKYTDRSGNEKTSWQLVGYMTEFHKDGGEINRIIEIPAIGLKANVFPQKDRDERGGNEDGDDIM
jgi:hypothetical protein